MSETDPIKAKEATMMYQANRGGHAPGHLRDAFCAWASPAGAPPPDAKKRMDSNGRDVS